MRLSVLGSGGPLPTPRPGCSCRVCVAARRTGGRGWRSGPCLYVPDARLLIDATETVTPLLVQAGVDGIDHLFITHWHPDHCAGFRVVEQVNYDVVTGGSKACTQVWMNAATYARMATDWRYFERRGYCRLNIVEPGTRLDLGSVKATWFNYAADGFVSGFVLDDGNARVALVLDETKGLAERFAHEPALQGCDLLVAGCGGMERGPDGQPWQSAAHPMPDEEAGFWRDTLPLIAAAQAGRTILTHLMDVHGYTPDELDGLAAALPLPNVQFAYDGLTLTL